MPKGSATQSSASVAALYVAARQVLGLYRTLTLLATGDVSSAEVGT